MFERSITMGANRGGINPITGNFLAIALIFLIILSCNAFSPLPTPVLRRQSTTHVFPYSTIKSASSDSSGDQEASAITQKESKRQIRRLEKFARFPVWPAWNGALIFLVGRLLGNEAAARLENKITGRVCPNFFEDSSETSPFLLLVHHCHSFAIGDLGRMIQNALILPEGFPSHPHRGFVTLTYFLEGGFRHRDSTGVEQYYGAKDHDNQSTSYPHSQWLNTGSGLLHEEMFDMTNPKDHTKYPITSPQFWWQRHELYQLWINLPSSEKMGTPSIQLLSDESDTPVVVDDDSIVRVLAGKYLEQESTAPLSTEMLVLHVQLEKGKRWTCSLPRDFETCFLYMRQGSLTCNPDEESESIPPHHTAFFTTNGDSLVLQATEKADFMLLAGVPIREPCVSQGSMVMNSKAEINQAYMDYQSGLFGQPWDHNLNKEEWMEHVRQFPSRYS